jgi:hypothetical protein
LPLANAAQVALGSTETIVATDEKSSPHEAINRAEATLNGSETSQTGRRERPGEQRAPVSINDAFDSVARRCRLFVRWITIVPVESLDPQFASKEPWPEPERRVGEAHWLNDLDQQS